MWVGCSAGVLESLTRLRPQKVVQFSYSVVILELNCMPNPRLEVLIKKCFFSQYAFSTLLHVQDLLTVTLPSLPLTSSQTTRQTSSFNRDMSA